MVWRLCDDLELEDFDSVQNEEPEPSGHTGAPGTHYKQPTRARKSTHDSNYVYYWQPATTNLLECDLVFFIVFHKKYGYK